MTQPQAVPSSALARVELLAELLGTCDAFLRTASPAVHAELRQFLTAHGYHPAAGLPAFLDQLQFALHATR